MIQPLRCKLGWTLSVVGALALGLSAPAANAKQLPALYDGQDFVVKPLAVSLTMDAGMVLAGRRQHGHLGRLRWDRWGKQVARTRAVYWVNDCKPSCVKGHYHGHSARVRARRVRQGHFTRLRVVYGRTRHHLWFRLGKNVGTYVWQSVNFEAQEAARHAANRYTATRFGISRPSLWYRWDARCRRTGTHQWRCRMELNHGECSGGVLLQGPHLQARRIEVGCGE